MLLTGNAMANKTQMVSGTVVAVDTCQHAHDQERRWQDEHGTPPKALA
jgi:hypothetical protein